MNPCDCCGGIDVQVHYDPVVKAHLCLDCNPGNEFAQKEMVLLCKTCNKEYHVLKVDTIPFKCDWCKAKDENMCVQKAIKIWKKYNTATDYRDYYNHASDYMRFVAKLSDTTPTVGRFKAMAALRDVRPSQVIIEYGKLGITEKAINEVISVSREHGYKTYEARSRDAYNREHYNYVTSCVRRVELEIGGTFCFEEDDKSSDLPF